MFRLGSPKKEKNEAPDIEAKKRLDESLSPAEISDLRQKLAEIGEGPLLPTLEGVPGKRTSERILDAGNLDHKHTFNEVKWPQELGSGVTDAEDGYYATYKYLFVCSCGAKKIVMKRAFI